MWTFPWEDRENGKATDNVNAAEIMWAGPTKTSGNAEEKANRHGARESSLAQELKLGDILKLKSREKKQSWFNLLSEKFSSLYLVSTGDLSSPNLAEYANNLFNRGTATEKRWLGRQAKAITDSRVLTRSQFYSLLVVGKRWKASSSGKPISSKDKATYNVSINI